MVSYEFQFDPYDVNDPVFDTFTPGPDIVQKAYGSEGERVVKLRARDDYGDYGFFAQRITIEPNQPPTVTLSGPATVSQGVVATFNAAILDPENDIAALNPIPLKKTNKSRKTQFVAATTRFVLPLRQEETIDCGWRKTYNDTRGNSSVSA